MPDHQKRRSDRRGAWFLLWAERLLVSVGAAALIWCTWLVADGVIAQRNARGALEIARLAERSLVRPAVEPPIVARRDSPVRTGDLIAALSIPRVQLSAVVLHGSDPHTLRRDSFFRPLRNVQVGDDVFMDTLQGQFRYQVTSLRVVSPHDVSVLEPTDEATLTLITCYPFWVLGSAPDRFIVRAARVVDASVAELDRRTLPPLDWVHAPALAPPAVKSLASTITKAADGDEALVRQAVERFRQAFNAHLGRSDDPHSGEPLRFRQCEIAVTDARSTATCTTAVGSPSSEQTHARTFLLERTEDGWAIRSIVQGSSGTASDR
jgi:sortase (surface protein transpeptidase)